ncbi:MAG: hypothetical protein U0167_15005 [bacterium]
MRPRICVTTWYDPAFAPLGDLCRDSLAEWCWRQRYDLRIVDVPRSDRPLAWHKVEILRHLLRGDAEFVLWVDADAIVVRPDVGIHGEIEPGRDVYLVEHHYDGKRVPNTGLLLLRRSEWTSRFLEDVWQSERYVQHPWWENAAIIDLLGVFEAFGDGRASVPDPARSAKVRWLPLRWNSVPEVDEADDAVIKHYAGRPIPWRMEHMQREAARLARDRGLRGLAMRWARCVAGA